jgi:energy-coupling factor transport system ATP-binding protein
MNEILKIEKVSFVYGKGTPFEKLALDNVSLSFKKGRITGLIGHTGSGKSTLVNLLNGLYKPTEGSVYLDGVDIWEKPKEISKIRYKVGLVMQYPEYQLFDETVRADIGFAPRNLGLDAEEIERRVAEAVAFTGIDGALLDKSPFELSGGQKRRVAIAGILAMRPRVLILDEPTAGLDPKGCNEILANIRAYREEEGATVVLVSHSMEDIAANAQRVMVLEGGHLKMLDDTRAVFARGDELTAMGLNVPQITRVFLSLAKRGHSDLGSVLSPEEAITALNRLTGGAK